METYGIDATAIFAGLAIAIVLGLSCLFVCLRESRLLWKAILAIPEPAPPSPSQAVEVEWFPGDVFLLHCSGVLSDEGMERLKEDFDALIQNPTTRAIVLEQGMRVTVIHRHGTGT